MSITSSSRHTTRTHTRYFSLPTTDTACPVSAFMTGHFLHLGPASPLSLPRPCCSSGVCPHSGPTASREGGSSFRQLPSLSPGPDPMRARCSRGPCEAGCGPGLFIFPALSGQGLMPGIASRASDIKIDQGRLRRRSMPPFRLAIRRGSCISLYV